VLDLRNQYEGEAVSFQNQVELQLEYFREVMVKTHQLQLTVIVQSRPITTFYTGGFPCEKVARAFLGQRFQSIYHLEGDILDYWPRCESD